MSLKFVILRLFHNFNKYVTRVRKTEDKHWKELTSWVEDWHSKL